MTLNVSGARAIVNRHSNANNPQGTLRINSGKLQYLIRTTGTGFSQQSSAVSLNANTWSHVVFNWNGTTAMLYINGIQDPNQYSLTGTIISTSPVNPTYIGAYSAGIAERFNGTIDEVRIHNRALSPELIWTYESDRDKNYIYLTSPVNLYRKITFQNPTFAKSWGLIRFSKTPFSFFPSSSSSF